MPARAMWKAVLNWSEHRVPVRLYSALQDQSVRFNLLHDQDMVRVRQRLVNPHTGQAVEYKDAQRGAEVAEGLFVILQPQELAELEPEASRDIDIVGFVNSGILDQSYYERPYYLGPDGDDEAYFALAKALERQEVEGLARWAMRRKAYTGALRAENGFLMLITLRHSGQVISTSDLEPPGGRSFSEKEAKMAEQLIKALEDEFDPAEYHDEYRDQVVQLIEAKRKGQKLKLPQPEKREESQSLTAVLQASLRSVRNNGRRGAAAKT